MPLLSVSLATGLWICGAIARAAEPALSKTAAPPSAGLLNDALREASPEFSHWDIGGQFRARYEIKENAGSFPNRDFIGDGQDNDNSYLLLREKFHIGYAPCSWFNLFTEARDSSTTGDDRNPNPEADQFDLHQAYLKLGDAKQFPITLKVGRQELAYGDERFVGASDWSNVGRVFDAAKLRFENDLFWVDAFSGRVVLPRDGHFNEANDYDWFSGVYASSRKLLPDVETELFFLSRNVGAGSPNAAATGVGGPGPRDVYTVGTRLKSLPGKFGGWDFATEMAGQFGSINVGAARSELDSFIADVAVGYTWSSTPWTPRLGLGYGYASGDQNPGDGKTETFENLFATNHKFYGVMDLWGPRNFNAPRVSASVKPLKKLSVSADYNIVMLADDRDSFYPESGAGRAANGYGKHTEYSKFVGTELDIIATCAVAAYLDFQLGYSHFFVGDYIEQSVQAVPANGSAVDADWIYAQMRFNF